MIAFEVKNVLSLEESFSAGEPKKVWVGFATGPRDVKKAETLLLLTKGIFVFDWLHVSLHSQTASNWSAHGAQRRQENCQSACSNGECQ